MPSRTLGSVAFEKGGRTAFASKRRQWWNTGRTGPRLPPSRRHHSPFGCKCRLCQY